MPATGDRTEITAGPSTDPAAGGPATDPGREFGLDAWRAAALVRIVVYHFFGYAWLPTVFPALGVMFAAAGSLTARSLTSAGDRGASRVIYRRFRRVTPTIWVYGAVALLVSVVVGWGTGPASGLVWWVLPLNTPGGFGGPELDALTAVLWYIAAYLWLVLLSPLLLLALRTWPRATLAVALLLPAGIHNQLVTFDGVLHGQAQAVVHYGACWVIGMAHREGILARIPRLVLWPAVAVVAVAAGVAVLVASVPAAAVNLDANPVVHSLWQVAFAAAVLRLAPLHRRRRPSWVPAALAGVVRVISSRSVTIYVWHLACIYVARGIVGPEAWTPAGMLASGALTMAILLLVVVAIGWVEDLAAGRPVRLIGRRPGTAARVPRQRSPQAARQPS